MSGPPGVAVEVLFHPAFTGADGAVVHAVAHVRAHKRHGRQLAIVAREGAERPVDAGRQVSEVNPRVVLALVAAPRASREAHFGHGLGVAGKAESSRSELMAQIAELNHWVVFRPWVGQIRLVIRSLIIEATVTRSPCRPDF
jgi:hypothetical protein